MSNSTAPAGDFTSSATSSFNNGGFTSSDTFTSPTSTFQPTTSSTPTTSAQTPTTTTPFQPTSSDASSTPTTSPATSATSSAGPPVVTSEITQSGTSDTPLTITITSTSNSPTPTHASTTGHSSSSSHTASNAAATSSGGSTLPTTGASTSGHHGLTTGGKVAIAVVVPVVAVGLIVLALLFLWRKRKQRKDAADMRRKEVEEYGFNPNNDPTLPPVGNMDNGEHAAPYEMREDDSGYRGWGAAPNAGRKQSTNLSSGGATGVARSDSGSQPGGYQNYANGNSPTQGTTGANSEAHSGDPLIHGHEAESIGALGGASGAAMNSANNKQGVHRGPSNASSSYSAAGRSDASGDAPIPAGAHSPTYYTSEGTFPDDPAYYTSAGVGGPYGDGSYGGGSGPGQHGQPVIRDVQARRNTRIENPSIFPQAGNTGISQNF
ncbi:hypothetical protein L228DRAFT_77957 [Xylona heveae TC161]|uniref:Uncharacterized protein n=1 Tax=Xylona heveae (strain CBS 132557 / TC161) TaxID=1328760 RepID=A0A165IXH1_XYLHT|nr:hypothetical protein L228DRAFT_77957 [Xylona heveae TC161]KZF25508.1 hypothetical protein L228DRAFT_77957 [Xylona heveae TC161]